MFANDPSNGCVAEDSHSILRTGSRELLVGRLLADEDISPDELRRIETLLQKRLDEASR